MLHFVAPGHELSPLQPRVVRAVKQFVSPLGRVEILQVFLFGRQVNPHSVNEDIVVPPLSLRHPLEFFCPRPTFLRVALLPDDLLLRFHSFDHRALERAPRGLEAGRRALVSLNRLSKLNVSETLFSAPLTILQNLRAKVFRLPRRKKTRPPRLPDH